MTRAESVARAQQLRAEGLTVRQVAQRMGVARTTAGAWLSDPDLSKQRARRSTYQGSCIDCGGPTNGAAGHGPNAPLRCQACGGRVAAERERVRFQPQRERVERLWAEGRPIREIADIMGWTGTYRRVGIAILRGRGYNLPYRRPAVAAKIRASRGGAA